MDVNAAAGSHSSRSNSTVCNNVRYPLLLDRRKQLLHLADQGLEIVSSIRVLR
ncbi:hypothetical protein FHX81_0460 [Saccharothrix saharensis]|uniref:Uncharacterized protein n=1 Tax=Saccharothrix saharensis TaxID=571190 RepID=A0A543J5T5_9PSEU|nr:hypothetical protein FHX81_0460 [Saccharothrix saharensis]